MYSCIPTDSVLLFNYCRFWRDLRCITHYIHCAGGVYELYQPLFSAALCGGGSALLSHPEEAAIPCASCMQRPLLCLFCRAPHELANGKITSVSYRSHLCDGMSFEDFEKLRRKSVKRAIELIEAAYSFCNDKITEEELRSIIGYKNYVGNNPEQ